jgi:hypothetical protein
LGLASLAISFFTENANYAILICSAAVPIGGIPVLQGLWEKGHKDSILPWVLFFIGGFLGLFNIKSAEVKEFAMPVTFSAFQTITLIVVIVARLKSRR